MYRLLLAAALATLAPAAYAADAQQMEANKKAVLEFQHDVLARSDRVVHFSAHPRVSRNPDESAETSVNPLGPRLRGDERLE